MTLITFQDGKAIMKDDGKIGTEQECCCCCTVGDTQYAPNATVSVTENITGCGEGAVFIDAPDLPMISCGVFEGPGAINGEPVVYKAIYNGDGTWRAIIDDVSDAFFLAVPISGTGGNTVVAFPCATTYPLPPLDRSSDVTITVTGVCQQDDDPP